jgi:hypothetical protein
MKDSRYLMVMDKLDRWVKLLGTVLVKVSFVDPSTGQVVDKAKGGQVQLDILHGGVYDIHHGASPYYITELLIGFGSKFGGFGGQLTGVNMSKAVSTPVSVDLGQTSQELKTRITNPGRLKTVNKIYWSPEAHRIEGESGEYYETNNPYGLIPAVPFFNQDPAHYYFLPINEPLIYANHAINMRITDLNHIAKFQSFGVPVVSGVERPTSVRQGRPVDDFNMLKGGTAQSKFGGFGNSHGLGSGFNYRNFDVGFGLFTDGNADANALGVSLGPDTAIAVGEKGDFKFEHPSADITGLIKTIESITDMVRINHGLRPKYKDTLPSSGFALLMEKIGVMEDNIRRAKLFKEREQQLFGVIKALWNTHYAKSGDARFSENAKLEVTYKQPSFPVDPKTNIETLLMENSLLNQGDRGSYKKLYPHLSDSDIDVLIKRRREDKLEQAMFDSKIRVQTGKMLLKAGLSPSVETAGKNNPQDKKAQDTEEVTKKVTKPKIDNRAKQSENSSKQGGKNGDPRKKG